MKERSARGGRSAGSETSRAGRKEGALHERGAPRSPSSPGTASSRALRDRGVAMLAGAVLLILPGASGAATTIGSDLSTVADSVGCETLGVVGPVQYRQCTVVPTTLPGRDVASPIDGVLVRLRVRAAQGSLLLRILRPVGDGTYMSVGTQGVEVPSADTATFDTRESVRAGDLLGLAMTTESSVLGVGSSAGAVAAVWDGSAPFSLTSTGSTLTTPREFLFNADIEADADRDGWGDESQDGCPVRAGIPPCADLALAMSGPAGNVFYGDELTFTFEVRNPGPRPAADAFLRFNSLGGFSVGNLTSSREPCVGGGMAGNRCPLAIVAPGEVATVVLKARSYDLGEHVVAARVDSSTLGLEPANDSGQSRFVVVLRRGRCANVRNGTALAEVLPGTEGGDKLSGLRGDDRLSGGEGQDCLSGGAGDDRLTGGPGADKLEGGAGDDYLRGDAGPDVLVGGPGRNRYSGGTGNDRIDSRNRRNETVSCGAGRDSLKADPGDKGIGCEVTR